MASPRPWLHPPAESSPPTPPPKASSIHHSLPRMARVAAAIIGGASCALAQPFIPTLSSAAAGPVARLTAGPGASVDRLTRIARRRYAEEAYGIAVRTELSRIASDSGLRAVLASRSEIRLRRYVRTQFKGVWYHQHASRIRIVRGSRTLVDVGVPFVVRPASRALRDSNGHFAGRLDVSIQDVIGYVGFMHRNHGVDIVVRGNGPQHVRSSLPAAARASLPDRGATTIAGRRYLVRSFSQYAFPHEPVRIWVLLPA